MRRHICSQHHLYDQSSQQLEIINTETLQEIAITLHSPRGGVTSVLGRGWNAYLLKQCKCEVKVMILQN